MDLHTLFSLKRHVYLQWAFGLCNMEIQVLINYNRLVQILCNYESAQVFVLCKFCSLCTEFK